MTLSLELDHQLLIIVYLAVKRDRNRTVLIEDRLSAASKVNDGQSAMTRPTPGAI